MHMQTVPMYELVTKAIGMLVEVTFRRYHGDAPTTLTCRLSDVHTQPLRVRVTIPPGARISDMHQFEGQDVILVLASPVAQPLCNGE
jgi:hypothetical protein